MEIKIPGVRKLRERSERGNPLSAATEKPHLTIIMNNLLKVLPQQATFSRVGNRYCDVRTIGATRCHFLGKDTRIPSRFLSRGNSARWNRAFHCERGNSSWQTGATRCHPSKRSKATAIYHWKRWNRIRIVSGIKIIRKQGEWSSAKKTETIFQRYRRWRKTFYYMGNVHVCNNGNSSIHGKELPEQLSFHREYKRSHIKTSVRHIYKMGVWTRWDLWIGNNWLGKSFMEILVFDWWWKSYQSSTHKGLRLFRFCIVSW